MRESLFSLFLFLPLFLTLLSPPSFPFSFDPFRIYVSDKMGHLVPQQVYPRLFPLSAGGDSGGNVNRRTEKTAERGRCHSMKIFFGFVFLLVIAARAPRLKCDMYVILRRRKRARNERDMSLRKVREIRFEFYSKKGKQKSETGRREYLRNNALSDFTTLA